MHESVEDGVGEGRVPDDVVPVLDRELAGDHSGADAIAVFGNLEQVLSVTLFRRGFLGLFLIERGSICHIDPSSSES